MVLTTIDDTKAADYLSNIKKETDRQRSKRTALQKNVNLYTITPESGLDLNDDVTVTAKTIGDYEVMQYSANEVAEYDFQYNVKDVTGHQHHGTITGAPTYIDDGPVRRYREIKKALRLDGVSDYVTLPNEASFDRGFNNPFTVECLINIHGTASNRMIVAKGDDYASSSLRGIYFFWNDGGGSNGRLIAYLNNAVESPHLTVGTAGSTFPVGSKGSGWKHVALSYSGNSNQDGLKIYIDGLLSQQGTSKASSGTLQNNDPVVIGGESDGSRLLQMDIANLRWYHTELSADQVLDRAKGIDINVSFPIDPPALLGRCDWG